MGITEETKAIIQAIANGNLSKAREACLVALLKDNTQKNKYFVNAYKAKLEGAAELKALPHEIADLVYCIDIENTFIPERYYETEFYKDLADKIIKGSKTADKLADLKIPYKNITLLHGEPGTGKTEFAKYLAYRMNLPLYYLNFSSVIDSFLGGTQKNIKKVFDYLHENSCIFMLDEVDAISCDRQNNISSSSEMSRVTITLLQELDRLGNSTILIAATNRIELLDTAFISRCSLKEEMKRLTEKEAFEMIRKYMNSVKIQISAGEAQKLVGLSTREILQRLIEIIIRELEKS